MFCWCRAFSSPKNRVASSWGWCSEMFGLQALEQATVKRYLHVGGGDGEKRFKSVYGPRGGLSVGRSVSEANSKQDDQVTSGTQATCASERLPSVWTQSKWQLNCKSYYMWLYIFTYLYVFILLESVPTIATDIKCTNTKPLVYIHLKSYADDMCLRTAGPKYLEIWWVVKNSPSMWVLCLKRRIHLSSIPASCCSAVTGEISKKRSCQSN